MTQTEYIKDKMTFKLNLIRFLQIMEDTPPKLIKWPKLVRTAMKKRKITKTKHKNQISKRQGLISKQNKTRNQKMKVYIFEKENYVLFGFY